MKRFKLLCGLALTALVGTANAALITFDDDNIPLSSPSDREIKDQVIYGGFEWSNFVYYDTRDGNGFAKGLKSGNNVGYNMYGNPASFTSPTAFTVNSLWATAGWRSGMSVTFLGYSSTGAVVHSRTITPSVVEPTLYSFDWTGIYKFGYSASGGSAVGGSDGTQLILDNITVNEAAGAPVTGPSPGPVTDPGPGPGPGPVTDPAPVTDPGPVTDPETGVGDTPGNEPGNGPGTIPVDETPPADPFVSDPVNAPGAGTDPSSDPTSPGIASESAVPSPATAILLSLGLLGWGVSRRKR